MSYTGTLMAYRYIIVQHSCTSQILKPDIILFHSTIVGHCYNEYLFELLYKIVGQKYSTIMYRPDIVATYCNIMDL